MNGPNIEFKILDIEENLDNLVWYLNQENSQNAPLDFYKFMFQLFPELQGKIDTDMNNEQIYMVLDKEIRPILENLAKTSKDVEKYRHTWNKVNDAIMKDLENTLKIKWPDNEKITCRIGLLPVCPRDIKNRTFLMSIME